MNAANIQYTLTANYPTPFFSFVAPKFLTQLPPTGDFNGPFWTLVRPQLSVLYCPSSGNEYCDVTLQSEIGETYIQLNLHYPDGTVVNQILGAGTYPIGLDHTGVSTVGALSFSIQETNADVTYAPEPGTCLLFGLFGLALPSLKFAGRLKR